jgi:hypothetical protein
VPGIGACRAAEATFWNQQVLTPLGDRQTDRRQTMGRYMLLWLIGVPIPILLLIWAFGGLH